jgi:exodeoxyribonuclease VII large subunit
MELVELSVSQFVDSINQTFEFAYPIISVIGEVANFKISKGTWVYFDLKDDNSSIRCFTSVYKLTFPVEDGMIIKVVGQPKLHNSYGFSFNVQSIQPVGEGTIKKAIDLLEKKLMAEGLFDDKRKRPIPYPPKKIGLITSSESAAYADFIKIINSRWVGLEIVLYSVLVQGDKAPAEICAAIKYFNELAEAPEVLVITRGGGSSEDLWAFSTEEVTRAVAASRVPTLVAIGHEIDLSLAEKAADKRASTPSNAAEILVPDKKDSINNLAQNYDQIQYLLKNIFIQYKKEISQIADNLEKEVRDKIQKASTSISGNSSLLEALNPKQILKRGYSIIKLNDELVKKAGQLKKGSALDIQFYDSEAKVIINELK